MVLFGTKEGLNHRKSLPSASGTCHLARLHPGHGAIVAGMAASGWPDLLSHRPGCRLADGADGAMEGSIELGNQSLYIQKVLGDPPSTHRSCNGQRAAGDAAPGGAKAGSSMRQPLPR